MTVFRPDGHLTEDALISLTAGRPLDELGRLEIAEHLAYCDRCLQRYTELLAESPLLTPERPCHTGLRRRILGRTVRLAVSRYATAAAAIALALTLLWGSAGISVPAGRSDPPFWMQAGGSVTAWTDTWPRQLSDALSSLSGIFSGFGGETPQTDTTQGGSHP